MDLEPNTKYYVRAYAISESGVEYGKVISFTTLNGLSTISTAEVVNIDITSAICGGVITSDGGIPIVERGVVWNTSQNPTLKNNKGITRDGSGIGRFESNMVNLLPNTTYYIRTYTTGNKGVTYGNELSFMTISGNGNTGVFTDSRDGNVYKTIQIGDQVWMAENLRYLPGVIESDIGSYGHPFFYVYGYKGSNVEKAKATNTYQTFGVLYNWPAANSVCPHGWHLPSDDEWLQLVNT